MLRRETQYIVIHRGEVDFDSYHFTVDRDGVVTPRNPADEKDKSCRNFNSVSVSICVVGDFCTDDAARAIHGTPTEAQWEAAVDVAAMLCTKYPGARVTGHTELGPGATAYVEKLSAPLSCPGTRFDMDRFRLEVKQKLSSTPVQISPESDVCV